MKHKGKRILCTLLTALLLLTGVPLAGFNTTADAGAIDAGVSLATNWACDAKGRIAISLYMDNAVGLETFDLDVTFESELLSYSSDAPGQDAQEVMFDCAQDKNDLLQQTNNDSANNITVSGCFSNNLWNSETFLENSASGKECRVNDTHFEMVVLYFTPADAEQFYETGTQISVTGSLDFGNDGTVSVSNTVSMAADYERPEIEPDDKPDKNVPVVDYTDVPDHNNPGVFLRSDWTPDDYNCIAVYMYLENFYGFDGWDLTLTYDSDVFSFYDCAAGKDAKTIVKYTDKNGILQTVDETDPGSIIYSGYFYLPFGTEEDFVNDSNAAGTCLVNTRRFESIVFYFKLNDSNFDQETRIDISGTIESDTNGTKINVSDSINNTCDHPWGDLSVTTPATCTTTGAGTYTCTLCSDTKTVTIPVNANNHTGATEIRNATPATKTECGYTGDTYCLSCNGKITDGKVIPMIGCLGMGTCGENVTWILSEEGVLTVSGTGAMAFEEADDFLGSLIIPWEEHLSAIKTVVIENGVTEIADWAFSDCVNLTDVSIAKTVTVIDSGAFSGCTKLASITLPDGITDLGRGSTFSNCSALKSIVLPAELTYVGGGAFKGCSSLQSVTFGNKITDINYAAFADCTSLIAITIPDSVTFVTDRAFARCTALKTVTIGSGVEYVVPECFDECTALQSFTVSATNENYSAADGVLYNKDKTELVIYPENKAGTSFTAPDGMKTIGNVAFSGNNLQEIILPKPLESIGYSAFDLCTALTDIYYCGSETEWNTIIDEMNDLENVTVHYNYVAHQHNYKAVVTAPTVATGGYTTYTCSCGDSYVADQTQPVKNADAFVDTKGNLIGQEKTDVTKLLSIAPEGAKLKDKNGKDKAADEKVGTGDKLVLPDGKEIVISVLGDINGDGEIATSDARLTLRKAVSLETFSDAQATAAKVDGGETVEVAHARKILRAAVDLEKSADWYKALKK